MQSRLSSFDPSRLSSRGFSHASYRVRHLSPYPTPLLYSSYIVIVVLLLLLLLFTISTFRLTSDPLDSFIQPPSTHTQFEFGSVSSSLFPSISHPFLCLTLRHSTLTLLSFRISQTHAHTRANAYTHTKWTLLLFFFLFKFFSFLTPLTSFTEHTHKHTFRNSCLFSFSLYFCYFPSHFFQSLIFCPFSVKCVHIFNIRYLAISVYDTARYICVFLDGHIIIILFFLLHNALPERSFFKLSSAVGLG